MRYLAIFIIGITMPINTLAAPIHSLAAAATLALRQDPRTAVVAAQLDQARAGRDSALSGYRPDVSVNASAGHARYDARGFANPDRSPTLLELTVAQPVYDFGRSAARVHAADAHLRAARAGDRDAAIQVIRDAAVAALSVDLAHQKLDTERHNVQVLARRLDYTRAKFRAGDFTRTDVAQAEARHASAQARAHAAEAVLARARARLRQFTGRDPDVHLDGLPVLKTAPSLAAALSAADSHPALLAARADVQGARDDTAGARAALRPRVDLVGAVSRDEDTRFTTETTSYWSAVLQVSMPLYAGGANRAAVRRARAGEDEAAARLIAVHRDLERRVRGAWADLSAAKDELSAARQQRQAAAIALRGMKSEVDAGARTVVDLLDAQQDLLNADLAVLDARYARTVDAIRLQAATGQLGLSALR